METKFFALFLKT